MPFGKANSSKLFCSWTDLWFASFHHHFSRAVPFHSVIGSYVDDAFGGTNTRQQTQHMIDTLVAVGQQTMTYFNKDKTRGPARSLVILGLLFCSISKSCRLGEDKRQKYTTRTTAHLAAPEMTSKLLEQLTVIFKSGDFSGQLRRLQSATLTFPLLPRERSNNGHFTLVFYTTLKSATLLKGYISK